MNANARSTGRVSARALVGWSVFTIAIVWLALVYADFDNASGMGGVPQSANPALKYLNFVDGLFLTTPYVVTALVCFGSFHPEPSSGSARARLVLRTARSGFRAAVILAVLPCAFVLFFFSMLGNSPARNPTYGVPEGAIMGIGICSLIVLAAGLIGALFGAVLGLLHRLDEGTQLELNR